MVRKDLRYQIIKRLETIDKWLKEMERMMEACCSDDSKLPHNFYYLYSRAGANMSQIGSHDLRHLGIDIASYVERYKRLDRFVEEKFRTLIPPLKADEGLVVRVNEGISKLYSAISE